MIICTISNRRRVKKPVESTDDLGYVEDTEYV